MASPAKSAAKRRKLDFTDENVTIITGTGELERKYVLHKGIISAHSTFLRRAFEGDFKESKDRVVRLPEIDQDRFGEYVQWAYTGEIVVIESTEENANGSPERMRLAQLYVVADQLGDTLLRNKVLDAMIVSMCEQNRGPNPAMIVIAYMNVPESSKLRKMVLDWNLSNALGKWLEEEKQKLPAPFFIDLALQWAKAGLQKGEFKAPQEMAKCTYHDHDEDVPSCV